MSYLRGLIALLHLVLPLIDIVSRIWARLFGKKRKADEKKEGEK